MRTCLPTVAVTAVLLASSVAACRSSPASNLTGTWLFHCIVNYKIDYQDPTFVFKQRGEKLTGTYDGYMGQQEVTGSVTGTTAVFGFHTPRPVRFQPGYFLETITATYTGTLETETKMSGTVEFSNGIKGKWTAERR